MSQSAYPTGAQVLARLTDVGLTKLPSSDSLTQLQRNAVAWWERTTLYRPFLIPSGATDTTLTFYESPLLPSGRGFLRLSNGLFSMTSLTVNGTAQVLDTDYWAKRDHPEGPVTWLETSGYWRYSGPSIVLIGKVGWGTSIPDDAWEAILCKACLDWLPAAGIGSAGGGAFAEVQSPSARVRFSAKDSPIAVAIAQWQGNVKEAVNYYRLKGL